MSQNFSATPRAELFSVPSAGPVGAPHVALLDLQRDQLPGAHVPRHLRQVAELARTYRFAATVFAINPAEPIDWGDLAGGAGYFGHEFRAFTGLTPTRYVEVRRRFLRERRGHALDGWPLPVE